MLRRLITILIFFTTFNQYITFASTKNTSESKETLRLIGGWDYPSDDYIRKYHINYARVVENPTETVLKLLSQRRDLYFTVNLKSRIKKEDRPLQDYLMDAEKWSDLSVNIPAIIEIAQDDFCSWWIRHTKKNMSFVSQVREKIKKNNPNLLYGATIYEEDFGKLHESTLKMFGESIDVVHFYLIKRYNISRYDEYIYCLKKYFPQARLIFGFYRYDRRKYEKRDETLFGEINMAEDQINLCIDYFLKGEINGIEFYPGRLGRDEEYINEKKLSGESLHFFKTMRLSLEAKLQDIMQ